MQPTKIGLPPWQPLRCRRLLLRAPRCHLPTHFQPAEVRLPAVFPRLAGVARSACLAAHIAPACDAKPHGYPSYNPLNVNVGLLASSVNANPRRSGYGSNELGFSAKRNALPFGRAVLSF